MAGRRLKATLLQTLRRTDVNGRAPHQRHHRECGSRCRKKEERERGGKEAKRTKEGFLKILCFILKALKRRRSRKKIGDIWRHYAAMHVPKETPTQGCEPNCFSFLTVLAFERCRTCSCAGMHKSCLFPGFRVTACCLHRPYDGTTQPCMCLF